MAKLSRLRRRWTRGLLLVCRLLFTGCDPYGDKKPFNFENSKWTCEDLNTWFIVDLIGADGIVYYGQIKEAGTIQELGLFCGISAAGGINSFDSVSNGIIDSDEAYANRLWFGEVRYYEDKVVLTESELNKLFPEDAFPITFAREDLTEEEIRALSPWDAEGNLKEE